MILLNKAKNYIINGALDYWQRGTSFASVVNGVYTADRIQYVKASATAVHTLSRDTDVPTANQAGFSFPYSCRLNLTTAQATLTASQILGLLLRLEGQVVSPLYKRKCTLSFWVKATLPGTYPVAIRNGSNTRCYVSTYVISESNVWEKKSITFTHDSAGTWATDTGIGILINFNLAGGTDYHVPALNTWLDGQYSSHSSCINGVQAGATDFKITGLQLEEGETASNFERAGFNAINELTLCQRYYERSHTSHSIRAYNIGNNDTRIRYVVPKRVSATASVYSPNTNAVNAWRRVGAGVDVGATTYDLGTDGFTTYKTGAIAADDHLYFYWIADAEL